MINIDISKNISVTGFPEWASIVVGGGVAIEYTGLVSNSKGRLVLLHC